MTLAVLSIIAGLWLTVPLGSGSQAAFAAIMTGIVLLVTAAIVHPKV